MRNPEYFYELIDAEVMRDPKDRETMYRELSQAVRPFDLAEQKLNAVRGYKRKESLRLGCVICLAMPIWRQQRGN